MSGVGLVHDFLDHHLGQARAFGWSEIELFGCYPDPTFASVRYDCMGAVTIAALMKVRIATVSATEIKGDNGLASRRPPSSRLARPVWVVFPVTSECAIS